MRFLLPLAAVVSVARCQGFLGSVIQQVLAEKNESFASWVEERPTTSEAPVTPAPIDQSNNVQQMLTTKAPNDKSCRLSNGEVGECVLYFLCVNDTVIEDGQHIIDVRDRRSIDSARKHRTLRRKRRAPADCSSYVETCCRVPKVTKEEPRTKCGVRNSEGVAFPGLSNEESEESNFGEFPWMVAILRSERIIENDESSPTVSAYMGGGSLIHPSIVLTGAHILTAVDKLRARAGEWDTQTTNEIHPHQERDVVQTVKHEQFQKGNLFNNVALLFLSEPMSEAPNVGVVCLPPPWRRVPGRTKCIATGWGKDNFGMGGRYKIILKKLKMPVVDRYTCQQHLRTTRLGHYFKLHSSFMCAGGQDKNTCNGDGGSPLVCPVEDEENRYTQNGIVAWGIQCTELGVPGVYVDVSYYRDWIDDQVRKRGYRPDVYEVTPTLD